MAELNADLSKVYVNSSDTNETIVVDARTLQVSKRDRRWADTPPT